MTSESEDFPIFNVSNPHEIVSASPSPYPQQANFSVNVFGVEQHLNAEVQLYGGSYLQQNTLTSEDEQFPEFSFSLNANGFGAENYLSPNSRVYGTPANLQQRILTSGGEQFPAFGFDNLYGAVPTLPPLKQVGFNTNDFGDGQYLIADNQLYGASAGLQQNVLTNEDEQIPEFSFDNLYGTVRTSPPLKQASSNINNFEVEQYLIGDNQPYGASVDLQQNVLTSKGEKIPAFDIDNHHGTTFLTQPSPIQNFYSGGNDGNQPRGSPELGASAPHIRLTPAAPATNNVALASGSEVPQRFEYLRNWNAQIRYTSSSIYPTFA